MKNSSDGINVANRRLAEPPIALRRIEAYVYDAYTGRVWIACDAGDTPLGDELSDQAKKLKKRINEQFRMPDLGYCTTAVDGRRRQVDACASYMGTSPPSLPPTRQRVLATEMIST